MTVQEKFGIVVMLDALGVSNFNIEECKQFFLTFDEIIKKALKFNENIYLQLEGDRREVNNEEMNQAIRDSFKNLKILEFGDTLILVWPIEKKEDEHNFSIIFAIAKSLTVLLFNGLKRQTLFRGCISIGDYVFSKDGKKILGPAVVDAKNWYESADWFGIIFTPKANLLLSALLESEKTQKNYLSNISAWNLCICEYNVPLKEHVRSRNNSKIFSVVGWPELFYYPHEIDEPFPKQEFYNFLFKMPIPMGTESKYQNSVDFFKWYESEVFQKNPKIKDEIRKVREKV